MIPTGHVSSVGVPRASKILVSWSRSESPARNGIYGKDDTHIHQHRYKNNSITCFCYEFLSGVKFVYPKEQLRQNASHCPHVNTHTIHPCTKQEFRGAVPPKKAINEQSKT